MGQHNVALAIQQDQGRGRGHFERLRHVVVDVERGRKRERFRVRFDKPFHVAPAVGKPDRNHTELSRLFFGGELREQRQLLLAHLAPRRPEHKQGRMALQRSFAEGLTAQRNHFEAGCRPCGFGLIGERDRERKDGGNETRRDPKTMALHDHLIHIMA